MRLLTAVRERTALGLFLVALYSHVLQALASDGWALALFWGWLVVGVTLVFGVEWPFPDAG